MKRIDIQTLLPVGEKLKPLLTKAVVTETDMRGILRKRGVFIGENSKQKIIPYLTMSILSPKEFDELQELQKTKEDSLKFRNKSVKSDSRVNLVDVLDVDLIEAENIKLQIENCDFDTDTNFEIVEANRMVIEYEILRTDITKDWASAESKFNGRIEVGKNMLTKEINLLSEYTSGETEEINGIILNEIIKKLKDSNEIKTDAQVLEIKSTDFSNEERFKFLLSLAKDSHNGILKFESVRNIEIGPDKTVSLPIASSNAFLDNSVKNIIINGETGETLQNIEYVTDDSYHESLILRALQVEYKFNIVGAIGTCIIEFGFPHFFRNYKKNKVFEVTINKLWFGADSVNKNKKNVSRKILAEFTDFYKREYGLINNRDEI